MGLKHTITKLEDVPEAVRSLYVAQGAVFVLDVDGVVPKDKLDEFRNNNISLQQKLDAFKDVDPTKYNELLKVQQQLNEKKLIEAGKVDEVVEGRVNAMRTTFDGEKLQLTSQLQLANQQLHTLLIDNVVKSAAIKVGALPGALDDVVLRAKGLYTVENGLPVPKVDGKVLYGKDGSSPMPVEEWLTGLRTTATHLFQGSAGSGAGGGGAGSPHGMDTSKMTAAQKINAGIASGNLMGRLPGEQS